MTDTIAIVSGDFPAEPPCGREKWVGFVSAWLSRLSEKDPAIWKKYDPSGFQKEANRRENWMEIRGRKDFDQRITQSIDHFIEMQHSQATWARRPMGTHLSHEFDNQLRELLLPYASNGTLEMEMESEVVWGNPLVELKH